MCEEDDIKYACTVGKFVYACNNTGNIRNISKRISVNHLYIFKGSPMVHSETGMLIGIARTLTVYVIRKMI